MTLRTSCDPVVPWSVSSVHLLNRTRFVWYYSCVHCPAPCGPITFSRIFYLLPFLFLSFPVSSLLFYLDSWSLSNHSSIPLCSVLFYSICFYDCSWLPKSLVYKTTVQLVGSLKLDLVNNIDLSKACAICSLYSISLSGLTCKRPATKPDGYHWR